MAAFATVMTVLSTVASAAGTVMAAAGANAQGKAAQAEANYQASILKDKAKQEEAFAQKEAQEQRRETEYVQSRHQAAAAASGFSTTDASNILMQKNIAGTGELYAQTKQYVGQQNKNNFNAQAEAAILSGKNARQAGKINAASTLIGGVGDIAGQWAKWKFDKGPSAATGGDLRYGRPSGWDPTVIRYT